MCCVHYSISNNVGEKSFDDTTRFLVNKAGNAFHTTTSSKSSYGRFCDSKYAMAKYFSVSLGSCHVGVCLNCLVTVRWIYVGFCMLLLLSFFMQASNVH